MLKLSNEREGMKRVKREGIKKQKTTEVIWKEETGKMAGWGRKK
jgi:hypothetical protein